MEEMIYIFKEIKKFRGQSKTISNCIDGEVRAQNITNHFQFKKSMKICTPSSQLNSLVDYYNRAGRAVYACAMDLSKAFDLLSWEVLFSELLEMGVSPLALRCLMSIYSN